MDDGYYTPGCDVSPLGLKPRRIAVQLRLQEITQAMHRYAVAYKAIPEEWIEELLEVNQRAAQREVKSADVCEYRAEPKPEHAFTKFNGEGNWQCECGCGQWVHR
jgi:hypothetical protein